VRFIGGSGAAMKPDLWKLLTSRNDGNPLPNF